MPSWTPEEYEQWKAKHPGFVKVIGALNEVKIKPAKRVRQSSKPLMNKLEEEFYGCLVCRFAVEKIKIQAIRFRLGNGIWYKPDFISFGMDLTCYEVKGPHAFRGGFENLKVAAGLYQKILWKLAWKENGQWKEQIILP